MTITEELLSHAVADFVDADAPQSGAVRRGVDFGADSGDDAAYGAPGDPHQLGTSRARRGHMRRDLYLVGCQIVFSGPVTRSGRCSRLRRTGNGRSGIRMMPLSVTDRLSHRGCAAEHEAVS
ncbi:hypothetical protein [Streptomyces sp. NPDC001388]|uniref:hypothetical protein n=1 Tax=Streptomyces sp. NPDC001388 TaxID=3364568 RepID=UPI0036A6B6A9